MRREPITGGCGIRIKLQKVDFGRFRVAKSDPKSDYCKNDSVPKGILNGIARFQNHQNSKNFFTAIQFLLLEIDFPLSREK